MGENRDRNAVRKVINSLARKLSNEGHYPMQEPQREAMDDIVFPPPNTAGEGNLPMQNGTAMLAIRMALELKELRVERGLAIKEIAERTGLDVATLSRLENGRILNPKLDTLGRYALALGFEIETKYVPIDPIYRE